MAPRPCSLRAPTASVAVACHAGSSPKSSAAVTVRPTRKTAIGAIESEATARTPDRPRRASRRAHGAAPTATAAAARPPAAASDETLGDELAHQPAAAGAEREPQRHLGSASGAAREQQVREVRARDQQQDRRRPPAAPSATWTAPARLYDAPRDAVGDLQALIEELGAAFPGRGGAVEGDRGLPAGRRSPALQPRRARRRASVGRTRAATSPCRAAHREGSCSPGRTRGCMRSGTHRSGSWPLVSPTKPAA